MPSAGPCRPLPSRSPRGLDTPVPVRTCQRPFGSGSRRCGARRSRTSVHRQLHGAPLTRLPFPCTSTQTETSRPVAEFPPARPLASAEPTTGRMRRPFSKWSPRMPRCDRYPGVRPSDVSECPRSDAHLSRLREAQAAQLLGALTEPPWRWAQGDSAPRRAAANCRDCKGIGDNGGSAC